MDQFVGPHTKVAFHLTSRTRQFLNKMHEFSELVLSRMALLKDQSRSVLPLRTSKARNLESCVAKKCTRALNPAVKLTRTSSFRPARTDKRKATIELEQPYVVMPTCRNNNQTCLNCSKSKLLEISKMALKAKVNDREFFGTISTQLTFHSRRKNAR